MSTAFQRTTCFISFVIISVLLGISVLLQVAGGVTPCPLCMMQRIILFLLGMVLLVGAIVRFSRKGQVFFTILTSIISFSGVMLAGRQVWLQHSPPDNLGECGVSLQYMLKILPIKDILKTVWQGGTECSQTGGQFLFLSLAEWSFIWFGLFFLLALLQLFRTVTGTRMTSSWQ